MKAAFDAINLGTHQGNITVWILGDTTETASAVLNASGVGSASYSSALMLPNGTRTVTGSLAAPLIDLNGAKNVRIDGYGSMTLSNTSTRATAGTSTIRFISTTAAAGGARNNVVANCTILGSSTVAVGANAGGNILFSTTTASGTNLVGNSNNTIIGNNIGPAGANLPIKCVTGLGTAGNNTVNRNNVIDYNNIFDFFGTGAAPRLESTFAPVTKVGRSPTTESTRQRRAPSLAPPGFAMRGSRSAARPAQTVTLIQSLET